MIELKLSLDGFFKYKIIFSYLMLLHVSKCTVDSGKSLQLLRKVRLNPRNTDKKISRRDGSLGRSRALVIGKKCNCEVFIRQAGSGSSLTKAFFFFFLMGYMKRSNLEALTMWRRFCFPLCHSESFVFKEWKLTQADQQNLNLSEGLRGS